MDIKKRIQELANDIGISKIGFTTADDFSYLEKSLRLAVENGTNSGFEHKNIEERVKPRLSLESAKTIISIAIAYPHKLPQQPQKTEYKRGKITPNSWGLDYHYVVADKLKKLSEGIEGLCQEEGFPYEHKAMVDTGALVDTAVARRAGIGFIGKNGLVISKEYGSYMFLGELITNLEIEPDQPVDYGCGDCTRCLTSCPTSCLNGDSTMNAKRCLSFQTQDKGLPAIFEALFPCGSITGAPKIATMAIIEKLEIQPRGVYCGTIGLCLPNGDALFNVAIRTLQIADSKAYYGVGGGITWDSQWQDEYIETQQKSAVLTHTKPSFELLTTAKIENAQVTFVDQHLERLR